MIRHSHFYADEICQLVEATWGKNCQVRGSPSIGIQIRRVQRLAGSMRRIFTRGAFVRREEKELKDLGNGAVQGRNVISVADKRY